MGRKKLDRTPTEWRAIHAAQRRTYRAKHPDRALLQRLRDAKRLLERHSFTVTGGDRDISTSKRREQ